MQRRDGRNLVFGMIDRYDPIGAKAMECVKAKCDKMIVKQVEDTTETLVGFSSPPGHDHDDNCLVALYECEDGHLNKISLRRKCPRTDCDWVGQSECFCHPGQKVDQWPEL